MDISVLSSLKASIDALRPLTQSELLELRKWYEVTYTFHSNAIEGNSLTLEETKLVVEDGLTVGGHPVREILEAKNHKEVVDDLLAVVEAKKDLTEALVFSFHAKLIQGIDDANAGKYRRTQVYITGEEQPLPSALEVPKRMNDFFAWYEQHQKKLSPPELAAEVHYRFVKIHPFVDGNGRIARVLSNLILLRGGYPLMIIPIIRRPEYIRSLRSTRSFSDFQSFFFDCLAQNMKDYLRMVSTEYVP